MTARSLPAACSEDYAECERILSRSGSSFALPIRLLPAEKRRATTALYALCRVADDIADSTIKPHARSTPATRADSTIKPHARSTPATRADSTNCSARRDHDPAAEIERLREDLDASLEGKGSSGVVRAVADTARRYGIPRELLHDVIDGVAMDLVPRSFDRFDQLEEYCRKVASAVGLAAIRIWGFRSEEALTVGHSCGVAFQLTNILRDVREDAAAGRLYLPIEDFTACAADPATLLRGGSDRGLTCVLERTIGRARACFAEAATLDPLLSTDGRVVFRAMYGTYAAIFRRIVAAPDRVLAGRVTPSKSRLAAAAIACIVAGPRCPPSLGSS